MEIRTHPDKGFENPRFWPTSFVDVLNKHALNSNKSKLYNIYTFKNIYLFQSRSHGGMVSGLDYVILLSEGGGGGGGRGWV